MYKKKLLDTYGHVHMRYIHEDEIYYFQNANAMDPEIIIATEFIPNLLTPQTTLPLRFCFMRSTRGVRVREEAIIQSLKVERGMVAPSRLKILTRR